MRKILFSIILVGLLFSPAFAETRVQPTIKGFNSTQLVKRGDVRVYAVDFIATSNSGSFSLHDVLADASVSVVDASTTVKVEGQEATAGNSKHYDFSNKPLEFSTGLYLRVGSGTVVISYD